MKRNSEYDPREEALQDMKEEQKDTWQEDDLTAKGNPWPVVIATAVVLLLVVGIMATIALS